MTLLWKITVEVPADAVGPDQRDNLFNAICHAALTWEPEERTGWDTNITATIAEE